MLIANDMLTVCLIYPFFTSASVRIRTGEVSEDSWFYLTHCADV